MDYQALDSRSLSIQYLPIFPIDFFIIIKFTGVIPISKFT